MGAFHVMAAGCGGIVHRGLIGPTHCETEPVVAGLWYAAHSRTAWLGFACERHADQLTAHRQLLPRDRDALERRRDRHRTELAGETLGRGTRRPARPRRRGGASGRAGEGVGSPASLTALPR
jgi:hypothetical protein